ncbi:MAG: glycosyltransferase [bacterium]|nr:glycosyltransferase [bacterium]
MVELSVIIPTFNRAHYLRKTVESILGQSLDKNRYEIIVIDNGSTDDTRVVIDELNKINSSYIRYFYESRPGLHVGRHKGAKEARGEILVYCDDDIIAEKTWLEGIYESFQDPKVVLVGGKNLPKWEGEIPAWISLFRSENEYGWTICYLSLLDFGDVTKEIPAYYVYGCNFSILKPVLFECGGFHPDSMPQELIRYRGDGETGLSLTIMAKGYKSVYEPKACVYHRVPSERMTIEYFCQRAFNQGVSDSYSAIRKKGGIIFNEGVDISKKLNVEHEVLRQVQAAYREGREYHKREVAADPDLLAYVLQEKYYEGF